MPEYSQNLNMPRGKEIQIPRIRSALYKDLSGEPIVFKYKGRPSEIIDFVRLAQGVGLNAEMPEEQPEKGILRFEMTIPREQFDKFIEVLHEWKTDI